jgi:hypothetical protein
MKWLMNEIIPFSVYAFCVVVCIYWLGPVLGPMVDPVVAALSSTSSLR